MSLVEQTLDGTVNKVDRAIKQFKMFEPPEGYFLAFSGGKDSIVIKRLAEMAGVKYSAHYNVTSVDPPELVRFIKTMPDVFFDISHDKFGKAITMWNLIPKMGMPPTRIVRYCCEKLKESNGKGFITVTGVRWAESVRRKNSHGLITVVAKNAANVAAKYGNDYRANKQGGVVLNLDNDDSRRTVEHCYRTKKTLFNPIISWTDHDVWEFIRAEGIPYCEMYDNGYKRLGCIGCPMNNHVESELEAYPKYKEAYIRAFDRMLIQREEKGLPPIRLSFKSGEEVMDWWLHPQKYKQVDAETLFSINNGGEYETEEDY